MRCDELGVLPELDLERELDDLVIRVTLALREGSEGTFLLVAHGGDHTPVARGLSTAGGVTLEPPHGREEAREEEDHEEEDREEEDREKKTAKKTPTKKTTAKKKAGKAEFADRGFKIYLTFFKWKDAAFRKELKATVKKAGAEMWDPELNPAVADWLVDYPLDAKFLASIKSLGWPDHRAIAAAVPGWDGEDAPYWVRDWSGIVHLPNLEELQWPGWGTVPADAIPEHPSLKKIVLPTKGDRKKNTAAFDALKQRGFEVESQVAGGQTTLVRK